MSGETPFNPSMAGAEKPHGIGADIKARKAREEKAAAMDELAAAGKTEVAEQMAEQAKRDAEDAPAEKEFFGETLEGDK